MGFRLLLWSLAVLVPGVLAAQQAEVTRYDVAHGLPQSMVNHVLQDRDGFIWLGTGDGLARFDGQRFVVYKHDPRDSTSIAHNSIWGLAEMDERHLWVSTRTGLDVLDRRTGRFSRTTSGLIAKKDGCWRTLLRRQDGVLFYSALSCHLLEVQGRRTTTRRLHHSPSDVMQADPLGGAVLLVIAPDTLLTISTHGEERVTRLPITLGEQVQELLPLGRRWLVLTDRSGWTWSEAEGRRPLPPATQAWMDEASKRKCGAIAGDGRIWVGRSGHGVTVLDTALRIVQHYPLLPAGDRPLDITGITFDRQGNVWVGTDGKGVFKIAPQRIGFGRCMPDQGLQWPPPSWFVRGFAQWDAHRVLVHFYQGGFALFDERSDELHPVRLPAFTRAALTDRDRSGPLTDAHGTLWLRDQRAVTALEPGSGRTLYSDAGSRANAMTIGEDGDVLLIARDGLFTLRRQGQGFRKEHLPCARLKAWMDSLGIVPSRMATAGQGRILLCQANLPISAWENDRPIAAGPFPHHVRFTAVAQADDGDVWMTSNDGLFLLHGTDLSIKRHWTVHDGLPDQFLYGMLPHGDGRWWLSSNNGLALFDPGTARCITFTPADGLQSTEFNSNAAFRSASGRLYFGGVNGFNHFHPALPVRDPDPPLIRPVALAVQDTAVSLHSMADPPVIRLPYGRNVVRLELAVLEMSAPELNRYRFRVPGYRDWTEQHALRPIELVNLPDGDWVVEVEGINAHGTTSAPAQLLRIHVPLPFRASPWAGVLAGSIVVLTLGGLAFLLYRYRMRRRLEHAEQQMKELRIRARIANDLHDDVGSGLARITALARTAERKGTQGGDVAGDVARVRALSQELMQDLRDVVWVNDPRDADLAGLLLRLRTYVQDLFEPTGAQLKFDLPDPLPEHRIGSQARRNLFLIGKEAAHNAFKYSEATRVTLRFAWTDGGFLLELADNGRGLPDSGAGERGHGVGNMRARAAEIGADCLIADLPSGGVSVRVAGPLRALHL